MEPATGALSDCQNGKSLVKNGRKSKWLLENAFGQGGEMQLLSAGHGPIFVYAAQSHRVHDYRAHGIPFGISGDFKYETHQDLELLPGDMLVLVTDGLFEWANPQGEEFGTERLMQVIQAAKDLPPGEVISHMYSAVLKFAGETPQQDDLTAVVLKRTAT